MVLIWLTFILFSCWCLLYFKLCKKIGKFPGPPNYFLLGSLPYFTDFDDLLNLFLGFQRDYGKYFRLIIANQLFIFISDRKLLKFFLNNNNFTKKAKFYDFSKSWLGDGLLVSKGEKHKERRKLLSEAFKYKTINNFIEICIKNSEVLLKKLKEDTNKTCVDVRDNLALCTLDIISETTMGININAQLNRKSQYVKSVEDMLKVLMARATSVFFQFNFFFKLSYHFWKERRALKFLHAFTKDIIKKRIDHISILDETSDEETEKNGHLGKCILDSLLRFEKKGEKLNMEGIREELETLKFQGHDSVASTLNFVLFNLGKFPDVQEKAVKEITSVFSEDDKKINYGDLKKLKYLEMIIKETLRLYPTFPIIGRELNEDIEIDGLIYPKGSTLMYFIYGLHRDEEYFPDPEVFDPERFSFENLKKIKEYTYLPFSAGSRDCIGQKFAMIEMKVILVNIIKNFEISAVLPNEQLYLQPQSVLRATNGVKIKLRNRTCE